MGDLLAHWGMIAFILYFYGRASRRVFVLQPQRGALLVSRFRRYILIAAATQPVTIGCVTFAGFPGVSDDIRKAGLQIFWVVQVSVIFGVVL
eukprot:16445439-Heterocapsa_arctica.AAC.1